ncbi:major tail protein [Oenococcus sp.]|uniref:major tail protein n=1 Tax=Oenococcus sp. TaxID=1979414 RepID=UPI0039EB0431
MVDTVQQNKVRFGLKDVTIIPITADDGTKLTYGVPFAQPGATDLTIDPEGDAFDVEADDMKFYTADNNQGYTGKLTLTNIVDAFYEQILGETASANGGFEENINNVTKPFALAFKISGDAKNQRFLFKKVTASRPSIGSSTKGSRSDVSTQELDTTMTADYNGSIKTREPEDTSKTIAAWATDILTPVAG